MKVAVVILNWNGRKMLKRFLPSVVKNSAAEVIVADNGSTDDSLSFLHEHYPTLPVITLDHNYGFAEGYNRALKKVEADYYILLNSDVECTPHWIEPIIEMMEKDPTIAVVQPKLRMYDLPTHFEYAGGAGGFIDKYGYPFCRGRLFSTLEEDYGQYDDTCDIFWASGAAMFVRAEVWHKVGGLDGDFFAHMEEIDFCWRVKIAGYRVVYCPLSTVYHVGGGTLPKSSPFKTELNFRNNLSMLNKNLPDNCRKKILRRRLWLDMLAGVKFLFEGHGKEYLAVKKAHKEYKKRSKTTLAEQHRHINPHPVGEIYQGHLLWEYYICRRRTFSSLNGKYSK